jgi:septum formation protein
MNRKIVLASGSARRIELLKQIGLNPIVQESKVDEDVFKFKSPVKLAEILSKAKAGAIAKKYKDAIIIGADTFIILSSEAIGKPKSLKNAAEILKKLSGRTHTVITGFTILDTHTKKEITKTVKTKVTFKKISQDEIGKYVYSSNVMDKAGAYAIQDKAGMFIKEIKGSYSNIVGLPIFELSETLREFGVEVSSNW